MVQDIFDRSIPGRQQSEVSVTKAIAGAGNYDDQDVLSESATIGTAWIFTNIMPYDGAKGAVLKGHVLSETVGLVHPLTLYLFNALPTGNLDDNVANDNPLHADIANYIGKISFSAGIGEGGDSEWMTLPGNLVAASTPSSLPLPFECADGSRTLWGVLVAGAAFTNEVATEEYIVRLITEVK